jgi:hypothetical protein
LEAGKGLYLEGTDFGYNYSTNKTIYDMFGITYSAVGGAISSVSGQSGSIVEGKSYNILANATPNTYVDQISSNGAKIIFNTNGGNGCGSTYEGADGTYRSLHTSFLFTTVRTEDARNELMKIYMIYLLGTGDQLAPVVSVTAPGAGEELEQGISYDVKWTATDNVGVVSRTIYFTDDDGATWTLVDSASGNTGSYDWTVPSDTSSECKIKVFAYDAAGNVGSNESAQFEIGTGDQLAPVVSVTAPGAGESLLQGISYDVKWTATDNVGVVSRAIYFSEDDGATWTLVDSASGNTGTCDWTVPAVSSSECKIKVFAYDAAGNVGSNESAQFAIGAISIVPNVFTIKPAGVCKVTITNVQGRIISSFNTRNLNLAQIKQSLPSGVHIVHILTSKGKFTGKHLLVR